MTNKDMQKTFQATYDAAADTIFRYCLIRVSDREQAIDLTQETFVRLWQSMLSGKKIASPRPFLFTIAHHLIIDWYRKKKAVSLEAAVGEEDEREDLLIDTDAHERIGLQAEGRHLVESIAKLGPYSQVVYLRFVEDLSPPEIAEVLGISANAVSVRINRGIEKLRRITGYDIDETKG